MILSQITVNEGGFTITNGPSSYIALTIGNFDGIHIGHKALINKIKEISKDKKVLSCLMSFEPHPAIFFNKEICLLSILPEKQYVLEKFGLDYFFVVKFDDNFSSLEPDLFLEDLLKKNLKVKYLVVGYDWRFGKEKKGDINLLTKLCKKLDIELFVLEPVFLDNKIVSSSFIRKLLKDGKIKEANYFLGHNYFIIREKEKGDGLGQKIGFPTINLKDTDDLCLKEGVYAGIVNDKFLAAVNYGKRPTVSKETVKKVEIHILEEFDNAIEKNPIKLDFLDFIREEKRFESLYDLRKQIEKDIELIRSLKI